MIFRKKILDYNEIKKIIKNFEQYIIIQNLCGNNYELSITNITTKNVSINIEDKQNNYIKYLLTVYKNKNIFKRLFSRNKLVYVLFDYDITLYKNHLDLCSFIEKEMLKEI